MCLCLFLEGHLSLGSGHTLRHCDLTLTNYTCKDPIPQQGHILRFQVTWIWGRQDSPQNSDQWNQQSQLFAAQDDIIESPSSGPNRLPEKVPATSSSACALGPHCGFQPVPRPAVWDTAESGTQVPGGCGLSSLQLRLEKWGWQRAQQPCEGVSALERMSWRNSAPCS